MKPAPVTKSGAPFTAGARFSIGWVNFSTGKPNLPVKSLSFPVAKPSYPVAKLNLAVAKPNLPVAKVSLAVGKVQLPSRPFGRFRGIQTQPVRPGRS